MGFRNSYCIKNLQFAIYQHRLYSLPSCSGWYIYHVKLIFANVYEPLQLGSHGARRPHVPLPVPVPALVSLCVNFTILKNAVKKLAAN